MEYILIGLVAVFVLMFVTKLLKDSQTNPEGFAAGMAKELRSSYENIEKQNPEMAPGELYIKALSRRPGYSVTSAERFIDLGNEKRGPTFKNAVTAMVLHEYRNKTEQATIDPETVRALERGVQRVIPEDY